MLDVPVMFQAVSMTLMLQINNVYKYFYCACVRVCIKFIYLD